MRRLLAAVVLAVLLWPAGTAVGADRWQPDVEAARDWAQQRQGTVAFAVRTDVKLFGARLDRQFPSASVVKAMLLVAYLRSGDVRDRALTAADRGLLSPMIRYSDNDSASRVRDIVGDDALTRLARRAGMTRFVVHPAWGLSLITARDQTTFFLGLHELLPERHRAYALGLLRRIVPEQRWGLARAAPDGWRLYFKGGWGAGTGAVNHQVGLLARAGHRVAIAVLTEGSPSQAYGNATLQGVSRRLLRGLEAQLRGFAGLSDPYLRPRL